MTVQRQAADQGKVAVRLASRRIIGIPFQRSVVGSGRELFPKNQAACSTADYDSAGEFDIDFEEADQIVVGFVDGLVNVTVDGNAAGLRQSQDTRDQSRYVQPG